MEVMEAHAPWKHHGRKGSAHTTMEAVKANAQHGSFNDAPCAYHERAMEAR